MAAIFDLQLLKDRHRIDYLKNLVVRGHEVFESVISGYGHKVEEHPLRIEYVNSQQVNARASSHNGQHLIEIEIAFPLTIDFLIKRICSEARFVPELPIDQTTLQQWRLPFSKCPGQILLDHQLAFQLDNVRFQLSELLMDFCNMFLLFHEIGHICCGHTQGQQAYFNQKACTEFLDWDDWLFRGRYLRRSWEIDADAFAGSVLSQFLEPIMESKKSPDLQRAVDAFGGDCAKITGVLIAALHVMFTYLAANNYALRKRSVHPSPSLRSKLIGNTLIGAVAQRYDVDIESIIDARVEYMAQAMPILEKESLFNWDQFDEAFVKSDDQISVDARLQRRFRNSCRQWSLLPLNIWSAADV